MAASREIDKSGGYAHLPKLGKEPKEQIAQLAVWRLLGLKSGAPEHQVTPETIQQDLTNAVSEQVKKNPSLLSQLGGGYRRAYGVCKNPTLVYLADATLSLRAERILQL